MNEIDYECKYNHWINSRNIKCLRIPFNQTWKPFSAENNSIYCNEKRLENICLTIFTLTNITYVSISPRDQNQISWNIIQVIKQIVIVMVIKLQKLKTKCLHIYYQKYLYLLEYMFNIDDITFIRHISFKCTINIFFVIFLMWYCDVWMWSYLFVLFLFLWIV